MTETDFSGVIAGGGEAPVEPIGEPFTIGNEYALARLCKVNTRNGERLEIVSPKLGFRILLDAVALEALSWQTPETLSRLLDEPYGPAGDSSA
jgi:hypothetical protein